MPKQLTNWQKELDAATKKLKLTLERADTGQYDWWVFKGSTRIGQLGYGLLTENYDDDGEPAPDEPVWAAKHDHITPRWFRETALEALQQLVNWEKEFPSKRTLALLAFVEFDKPFDHFSHRKHFEQVAEVLNEVAMAARDRMSTNGLKVKKVTTVRRHTMD